MRIIKLDAIDSTNSYLRQLSAKEPIEDDTVVVANYQTHGRGQMGTKWDSQESKNLMISIFKDTSFIKIEHNFHISMVVSLSIFKALQLLQIKKLKIKWPNDILADNKKIAGILIENVIKQNQLQASIIGVGMNVNQTEFGELPSASSLLLITGKVYDLDEILYGILKQLKFYFQVLKEGKIEILKREYEDYLFRKNKPSTFLDTEGQMISGIICGISDLGNLQVKMEDQLIKEFDLKNIKLLY